MHGIPPVRHTYHSKGISYLQKESLLHCCSTARRGGLQSQHFIPGSSAAARPLFPESSRRVICTVAAMPNEILLLHMAHISDLVPRPKLTFGKQACYFKFPLNHFSCYTTSWLRKCSPHRWVVKTGHVSKPASVSGRGIRLLLPSSWATGLQTSTLSRAFMQNGFSPLLETETYTGLHQLPGMYYVTLTPSYLWWVTRSDCTCLEQRNS